MADDKLPTFEADKLHILKGSTLNTIVGAIVKEIIADKTDLLVIERKPNKVELRIVNSIPEPPAVGQYVLTAQNGVLSWEEIEDC